MNHDTWHSYASSYAVGHRTVADLFAEPVAIEEKVDGSQFSFGIFDDGLRARSKGKELVLDAPEKMFQQAVDTVRELGGDLVPGWTYRGEYLQKPKHNTLAYDRVPAKHIIIFDIETGNQSFLGYEAKAAEAARLGLEVVPLIYHGMITSPEQLKSMLDRTSILGGQKIEGVMAKNYARMNPDKKIMIGKFVSEQFKEIHQGEWKKANPASAEICDAIIASLKTPARWHKAIQHLRDRGELTNTPRDIGGLIKEVHADIDKECLEYVAERLMAHFMPKIHRGVVAGLPEFYKDELLKSAFDPQQQQQ